MIHLRILTIPMCGLMLMAQTPVETDAVRELGSAVQDSSILETTTDSPVKPTGWGDEVIAESNAMLAATTTTTATSITVPAGGNIQAAINAANPGDTIILKAGAVYPGGITLPAKSGTSYITITTSAAASLPGGQRVGPSQAWAMARIVGKSNAPVISTALGAHHYRLIGLEILVAPGVYGGTAVQLGSNVSIDSQLPYDIELDRTWIHAEAPQWAKRGLSMNGKRLILRNSTVSGFRSSWQETQAIIAWNTPGPLQIANNYLEAGGMPIMIGGAEPALVGVTPSDIQITGNRLSRPVAWRSESVIVKNLLELKTGRRVTITGNILENTWAAAQTGYAVNIKPGTENIRTPAITSEILFANNIVRHTNGGIVITGTNTAGGKVTKVIIRNNLFDDIGPNWGYRHSLFTLLSGISGVTIENNTASPSVLLRTLILADGTPTSGLVFRANISQRGEYGVFGSGCGEGTKALAGYFPSAVFTNNVIYQSPANLATSYPAVNYFPFTASEVGWSTTGNYSLSSTSPYKGRGIGGLDPGINVTTLTSSTLKSATGR